MEKGKLFVVATPIGNLGDMSFRAIEVLKQVDVIAAEDTRHSAPLLRHFAIQKPIVSLHEYNERDRSVLFIQQLREGKKIALISDAGTPLISDPGFFLVREAKQNGIDVIPVPGPCAAIAALSVAGLPSDRFIFEGFLPAKSTARKERLGVLCNETRTLIFYESPNRLPITLQEMAHVFGPARKAVVARELTKLHETVIADTLSILVKNFATLSTKGECVVLVAGYDENRPISKPILPDKVLDILLTELPINQATMLASKITGQRKNELYRLALTKKSGHEKI